MRAFRLCQSLLLGFGLVATVYAQKPQYPAKESLAGVAPFPVGAALSIPALYKDAQYQKVFRQQFNSATAENIMKMKHLQPTEDEFFFDRADSLVAWCQANKIRLHGHCLVWHEAVPDWVLAYQDDKTKLEAILKRHVQFVAGQFKGKLSGWDVVNEAFNDDGSWRETIWYKAMGPSYVEKAFAWVKGVDASTPLFYNDYGLEYAPKKRAAVMKLVAELKAKGLIQGLGWQAHLDLVKAKDEDIATLMEDLKKTGLQIHISELDIAANGYDSTQAAQPKLTPELATQQGDRARLVGKLYRQRLPRTVQYGVTFWGFTDKYTWVPKFTKKPDWPLPFDDKFKPKALYEGAVSGLRP